METLPAATIPAMLVLFGAFWGSFLNVCIHRLPAHRSIVFPRSACPACGTPIRPWHNVPVVSWLALRGRCAACRAPISARYPIVEALTPALFLAAWARFGPGLRLAEACVFLSLLVVLFFTDIDTRLLPDTVTLTGTTAGLGLSFLRETPGPALSFAAAAGGGAALWLLGALWKKLRPGVGEAMGLGDVKMMAMIGAFLGPLPSVLTVFLGSLLGTILFLATRAAAWFAPARQGRPPGPVGRVLEAAGFLVEGRGAGLLDRIPFGSMLALGATATLFAGDALIGAYLSLAGLAP